MKKIGVWLPITGVAYVEIKVKNGATEDDIFCKAMDVMNFGDPIPDSTTEGEYQGVTWETHKKVVDGNVFCGVLSEMDWKVINDK